MYCVISPSLILQYIALSKPSFRQGNSPRWMSPLRKNSGSQRTPQVGEQIESWVCIDIKQYIYVSMYVCMYSICTFCIKTNPFPELTTTASWGYMTTKKKCWPTCMLYITSLWLSSPKGHAAAYTQPHNWLKINKLTDFWLVADCVDNWVNALSEWGNCS